MNGTRDEFREERELWKRVRVPAPGAPSACPGPAELAAYLDGACRRAARDRIEEHLRICPACVGAVAELRRLLRAGPAPAPAAVFERARGLVARPPADGRGGDLRAAFRGTLALLRTAAAWAAAAALVASACAAGFTMGREAFPVPHAAGSAKMSHLNPDAVSAEFGRLEQPFLGGELS